LQWNFLLLISSGENERERSGCGLCFAAAKFSCNELIELENCDENYS